LPPPHDRAARGGAPEAWRDVPRLRGAARGLWHGRCAPGAGANAGRSHQASGNHAWRRQRTAWYVLRRACARSALCAFATRGAPDHDDAHTRARTCCRLQLLCDHAHSVADDTAVQIPRRTTHRCSVHAPRRGQMGLRRPTQTAQAPACNATPHRRCPPRLQPRLLLETAMRTSLGLPLPLPTPPCPSVPFLCRPATKATATT